MSSSVTTTTTTTTNTTAPAMYRRRIGTASAALLTIGLVSGVLAYLLTTYAETNALVLVPAVIAATLGASNLIRREAR